MVDIHAGGRRRGRLACRKTLLPLLTRRGDPTLDHLHALHVSEHPGDDPAGYGEAEDTYDCESRYNVVVHVAPSTHGPGGNVSPAGPRRASSKHSGAFLRRFCAW